MAALVFLFVRAGLFLHSLLAGDDIGYEAYYHACVCTYIDSVDVVPAAEVAEDKNHSSDEDERKTDVFDF